MQFFSRRSTMIELMDNFHIPQNDLNQNLLELEVINRFLGGYAVSFAGISKLKLNTAKKWRIADVGCGGGDGMIAIYEYLKSRGIEAEMTGIDANPNAIAYAKKRCRDYPHFHWVQAPFQDLELPETDVFHCSLFAHHFYNEDLEKLSRLFAQAKLGYVINDLHRSALAYYGISLLTTLFSKSYLVKHDARLSVAKGFQKNELKACFNLPEFTMEISWQWAFRWLTVGKRIQYES